MTLTDVSRPEEVSMLKALLSLAAVVLVVANAAVAAPPEKVTTEFDRTRVIAASPETCPFDIQVQSQGIRNDWTFTDNEGNVVRTMTMLNSFKVAWTNLENGRSLTTPLAGPVIVEPRPDGTVIVYVNGNDGHFVEPGEGPVFSAVGRLVYRAHPDTLEPIEVLQASGRQDPAVFPAVCEGLV
jgi:hypothetical protein